MKMKYPMKGDQMQSLYGLAWFGKPAHSAGAGDPLFSGYHAAEPAEEAGPESEAEVLAAELAVGSSSERSAEEVGWMLHRKRMEAERVLHLFKLGFTEL